MTKLDAHNLEVYIYQFFFFSIFFLLCVLMYLQTAQNICPEYQTPTYINFFFPISSSVKFLILYFTFCQIL